MADAAAISLDCINAIGNGVRVEFQQCGDRFEHSIFGVCGDQRWPLLRSVGGKSTEVFPVSPPWTDVHQQDDTLFFTGATAHAHWSMSVHRSSLSAESLSRESIDNRSRLQEALPIDNECSFLDFDIACRLKKLPCCIGSVYECAEQVETAASDSSHVLLTASGRKDSHVLFAGSLSPAPEQGCRVVVITDEPAPDQLRIAPWESVLSSYPATVQWRYGVCSALG